MKITILSKESVLEVAHSALKKANKNDYTAIENICTCIGTIKRYCINKGITMTEKHIEQKLVKAVKARGGIAPKFVSPGFDGVPDRIVLLPHGRIAFIEMKAKGRKMRPLQARRKSQLESLGFSVYCIDSPEQIGGILDEIQSS